MFNEEINKEQPNLLFVSSQKLEQQEISTLYPKFNIEVIYPTEEYFSLFGDIKYELLIAEKLEDLKWDIFILDFDYAFEYYRRYEIQKYARKISKKTKKEVLAFYKYYLIGDYRRYDELEFYRYNNGVKTNSCTVKYDDQYVLGIDLLNEVGRIYDEENKVKKLVK